jgi:hypothetical protein
LTKSSLKNRNKGLRQIFIANKIVDKKMDIKREWAIETIKEIPQEFELEALIERLVFVEKGISQLEEGKTTSHEKVNELSNVNSKSLPTNFD